ncbi:MAG: GFA family protein [Sphingomonadales bacterium]|nr:MAG: GFA family protein [Sphingomonadales bacterium]
MTRPTLPLEGGCRCGKVRLRITQPPMITMACHCNGCQKMSASAYSLSVAIPEQGFQIIAGDPVIGGLHGAMARHHHCDWCKSWMFTLPPAGMGFVNVRPTMLDDCSWYAPFVETYVSEKLPWATTSAKHSFPQFPPMEAFGELIAEYTAMP